MAFPHELSDDLLRRFYSPVGIPSEPLSAAGPRQRTPAESFFKQLAEIHETYENTSEDLSTA